MPKPLIRVFQSLRRHADARARRTVLVLGDSHVRVFEHWWLLWAWRGVRWHVEYVPGGTALGLYNKHSASQAHARFAQALASVRCEWVIVNLGEVDTGHALWAKAARDGSDVQAMLTRAVERYARFIGEIAARHRLIVLSAPLPTLPDDLPAHGEVLTLRKALGRSQQERTALTLEFNRRIAAVCAGLDIPYLDDAASSLGADGRVQPAWLHRRIDHHYRRSTYARWLSRALVPYLSTAAR
jgi:hypothetical protein